MSEIETFRNRYGDERVLERISETVYEMSGSAHYCRMGYREDGSHVFFDPEGGPFIMVGDDLLFREEGSVGKVKRIELVEVNNNGRLGEKGPDGKIRMEPFRIRIELE